jgi:PHS family inorganic phosphate transporter-like MFS transporter
MLASVFIMQPLGQFAAYLVGLVVLLVLRNNYHLDSNSDQQDSAPVIDMFWRWVTGLGAVPAVIALVFRLTIPESGRWRLDVQGQADRAIIDTHTHFGTISDLSLDDDLEVRNHLTEQITLDESNGPAPQRISFSLLRTYLIVEGNWRYLAGTSLCWAMFDFGYYALQINNPRFLAKLWASSQPERTIKALPAWLPNPARWNATTSQPTTTVYQILLDNSVHSMISVSAGSILGSLLLICVIDYLPRRKFLMWSFIALALLTAGTGISYLQTFRTANYGITLALFILCQVLFNLGPNTLTFIIPAEIFPTPIRCTCHGIAAASGKLASVFVQATLPHMKFGGLYVADLNSNGMGWVLIIFSAALAMGALFAWAWIPDVQSPRPEGSWIRPSKTLEELALGRKGETEEEKVGMRKRIQRMKR